MQRVSRLKGKVQHYTWGGNEYIPQLLQQSNADYKPYAEYWLGAHPNHPSNVLRGTTTESLDALIQNERDSILGTDTTKKFSSLPYLLKVLDVSQMLSIQVHPSKEEAEKGYKRENEMGIALTASHRNYKDENHKPELMVALSDFWLLHGFKQEEALEEVLKTTPELKTLLSLFKEKGYKSLYEYVMTLTQAEVDQSLAPLAQRVVPLYQSGRLDRGQEDFWAARAILTFCKDDHYDRGIYSIYLFNLLQLKTGEGIFQPAGMPHAYLEGQNVEIMANSDNVLRAGLTDKHIDVPELLKHTNFSATIPQVIKSSGEETFYKAPVPEFGLYQYHLQSGLDKSIITKSAEIYLVLEGEVKLQVVGNPPLTLQKGESAFVYAQTELSISAPATGLVFRATIGGA